MRAQSLLAAAVVTSGAMFGANSASTCREGFEVGAVGIRELALSVKPSQVRILGTPDKKVRVRCEVPEGYDPSHTRIDWSGGVSSARLTVRGGGTNNYKILIEVPENTDLTVRVKAGDVSVRGVAGNKDIEMMAGDLKIQLGRPDDYSTIDTSVRIGDLEAIAFRKRKGGFFRSFTRHYSPGKYKLHASLLVGNLRIE
jgi:hypothetical protein